MSCKSITLAIIILLPMFLHAKKAKLEAQSTLAQYVARNTYVTPAAERNSGSLWSADGALAEISMDYKARHVNDLIKIQVVESTVAQNSGSVTGQRQFDTRSGITGLAGKINTGGLNPLLSLNSATNLQGKGQASTQSSLRSTVGGRVAAVLPNGNLIVEAERQVTMNNEKQTVILRGLVRPGDVASDNSVLSTSIANLELELKGKGVISDFNRPPNPLVRAILWIVGF